MAEFSTPQGGLARGLQSGIHLGLQYEEVQDKKQQRALAQKEAERKARRDKLELSKMFKDRLLESADINDPKLRKMYLKQVFSAAEEFTGQKTPTALSDLANNDPEQFRTMLQMADKQGLTMVDIWKVAGNPLDAASALQAFSKAQQTDATRSALGATTTDLVPSQASAEGPDAGLIASIQARIADRKKGLANAVAAGASEAGIKELQNAIDVDEKYLVDLSKQRGAARQAEDEKPITGDVFAKAYEIPTYRKLITEGKIFPGMTYREYRAAIKGVGTSPTQGGQTPAAGAATGTAASPTTTPQGPVKTTTSPTSLSKTEESKFQAWYAGQAKKLGLNPNPDDPQHFYDWRAAYKAGAKPDASGHWPSTYKREGHPNMVVGGVNTKTGEPEAPIVRPAPVTPVTPTRTPLDVTSPGITTPGALGSSQMPLDERGRIEYQQAAQLRNQQLPESLVRETGVTSYGALANGIVSGKIKPMSPIQLARKEQAAKNIEHVYGKKFEDYQVKGEAARISRAMNETMLSMIQQAGTTGPGLSSIREGINAVITTIIPGFNPTGMTELQMMKALSTKMAIEDLKNVGGNDSDKDFLRAITSNPNIFNVPEANVLMLTYRIQSNILDEHRAKMAQKWVDRYESLSASDEKGRRFDEVWSVWASKPENSAVKMLQDALGSKDLRDLYKRFGIPYRGK
jgi:hypothetical protein